MVPDGFQRVSWEGVATFLKMKGVAEVTGGIRISSFCDEESTFPDIHEKPI